MTRRARPLGVLPAVRRTIVVIVAAAGLAACGGGGDEQQTEARPATQAATETSGGNGEVTNETNETNGSDETNENGSDETTTDDTDDDGGCPADGSGNCTFIIHCPEADYEYSIPGPAAASATIVGAEPTVAPDPDTPARSVDDLVDVTVEVEAERVKLTTLCADGITSAEATQPLEATGG